MDENKPKILKIKKKKKKKVKIKEDIKEVKAERRRKKKEVVADKPINVKQQILQSKQKKWSDDLIKLINSKSVKPAVDTVPKPVPKPVPDIEVTGKPNGTIQNTIARINYPYQRKCIDVEIENIKNFLNKYLPKYGTTQEIKTIGKEYSKITAAINSCRNNNSGFIKYRSRSFYFGKDTVYIEIMRGRQRLASKR